MAPIEVKQFSFWAFYNLLRTPVAIKKMDSSPWKQTDNQLNITAGSAAIATQTKSKITLLYIHNIQNHGTTWILFKLRWTQSLKGHKERTKYKNCSDTFLMPILYFPRSLFFVLLSLLGFKFMKNRLHIFCTVECGSELAISWSWIRMQIRIIAIGSTTLLTKYACKKCGTPNTRREKF